MAIVRAIPRLTIDGRVESPRDFEYWMRRVKDLWVALSATLPIVITGSTISIKNDVGSVITEIDTGVVDNSDLKISTSKAIFTALALKSPVSSPTFTGLITTQNITVASLSDGYIPYHLSDAVGFIDGPLKTDADSAITLKHSVNSGGDFLIMQVFS